MIDVPRIVFPQGHTALGLQEDGRLQLWTLPPAPSTDKASLSQLLDGAPLSSARQ